MGNNLPHELTAEADDKLNGSQTRRKISASVDEIRDLYSALQELVPSQSRPQPTSSYGAIPEETSTSRGGTDTVEDASPRKSNPSSEPAFTNHHRCSSPLPLRSQPKVIQRKRSNSCFAISAAPNSLASPSTTNVKSERRRSCSSTESRRIHEQISNLIENFGKENTCRVKSENKNLRPDLSEVEESSSKRRHSGGNLLEERREKFKDPQARMRRRSIGGSLLLDAIIKSDSSREDSLANALNIIARKDELQEIIQTCQEDSEQEKKDSVDVSGDFDEVDGIQQQQLTPRNAEVDSSRTLISEHQEVGGNSSTEEELQAVVGDEMHDLLEALQGLVVTGESGTTPPPSSKTSSRRTSWVEKCSPKRKESLNELEAFFKNKLDEMSEKENNKGSSKDVQRQNAEATKDLKNKKTENYYTKDGFRRSSLAEQFRGGAHASSIHRSQSTAEFLSPTRVGRHVGPRRASVQIEVNRTNRAKAISNESSSLKEKKHDTRLNKFPSRSKRRKSDIPIIRKEEVFFRSKDLDADEAHKRALWKEDQEAFAKQVNQRLQDWLERATAISLSTAENTEDDSESQKSSDINDLEISKEENAKTKRAKFAIKKAFKGRIKRSKSLHNILEPEEIKVEKPKNRSPVIERSKQNLRKFGPLRLPRSVSMLNTAASIKPKFDQVDTKSTESDESYESSSSNIRRSTILYEDDSSPEMIPKANAVDISGENLNTHHLSLRRRSCPTPNDIFVNNSIDSKRISRLPVDLPLFYAPETDSPNLRVQKKVENCQHNSSEKENKMPPVCKKLFPVRKEIVKNELFYNEPRNATQLFPKPLISPPTVSESSPIQHVTDSSCSAKSNEDQFMMFQNYDLSKLSFSNDFGESFEEFRDRTKSTESEDSGCPNTNDLKQTLSTSEPSNASVPP